MTTESPDPNKAGKNWASPEVAEQWNHRQHSYNLGWETDPDGKKDI